MSLLWKPLLAATLPVDADLDALPYPLYGSPKINGFRCMVQGGVAVTRKGLPFRNQAVQDLLGNGGCYEGLDGELCVGKPNAPDTFNRTQNVVNSGKQEAYEEFRLHGCFHVFGWFGAPEPAEESGAESGTFDGMYAALRENPAIAGGYFRIVPQTPIKNAKRLAAFEAQCLARGYEGAMLLRASRPAYPMKAGKENRSTLKEFDLVKWKRVETGTAIILEAHYLEHNRNEEKTATGKRRGLRSGIVVDTERVGSLTVRDVESKVVFSITVASDALRNKGMAWWERQLQKRFQYKYTPQGRLVAPVHPRAGFEELL